MSRGNVPQKQAPWFKFWAKDWLTDERIERLTPAAQGALIQLRARAWIAEPPCSLPDDDVDLARLSGLQGQWKRHSAELRAFFSKSSGRLVDEYLAVLYAEMSEESGRRSASGRTAARARWAAPRSASASSAPPAPPAPHDDFELPFD